MDIARKILHNYGWKDGNGLGRNKDGIAKPLKATLKFDKAGFGADQAATDFNNHWWERVFDEAASNVNITEEGKRIKMSLKDDEGGVEISTKGYSIKKLKKLKQNCEESTENKKIYENFLKAATLTNHGIEIENPNRINTNDIEVCKFKVLTDEELFKACGGRTAHKGARHGLKLSGKLSRIEQQETELLAKMLAKDNGSSESNARAEFEAKSKCSEKIPPLAKEQQRKKKSKARGVIEVCETFNIEDENLRKNKRKHTEMDRIHQEIIDVKRKKKVSNKNSEIADNDEETSYHDIPQEDISDNISSSKRKNKHKMKYVLNTPEETMHKKKKKKSKRKDIEM